MRRLIPITLALILLPAVAWAQVRIAKSDRVANTSQGHCAWCALETLGRHQGIKELVGLVEQRKSDPDVTVLENGRWVIYKAHAGYDWTIRQKLDQLGVKYRVSPSGAYDRSIIQHAVDNNLGFAVSFRRGALGKSAHAVTGIKYTDKEVVYIDPNDRRTYTATRDWFDHWWDGWALVLEDVNPKPNPTVIVKDEPKAEPVAPVAPPKPLIEQVVLRPSTPEATPVIPTPPVTIPKPVVPIPPRPVTIPVRQPNPVEPSSDQVRPVIIGLDLKPIDIKAMPQAPSASKSTIIQWRLTQEK